MKKVMVLYFLCLSTLYLVNEAKPKILHLSFHKGCVKDFEHVANELGYELHSWFILETKESRYRFDPAQAHWNAVYSIGHDRAKRIWDANKEYFNQFDAIITSDTVPLARIFLQNGWQKPLIVWMCNRLDYYDGASKDCDFPDKEFYELFRNVRHQKNVKIIGYVAYEHFYAKTRGVETGTLIIKPCGSLEQTLRDGGKSFIPDTIKKQETFFIPPRLDDKQKNHLLTLCNSLGIKAYCGTYNGPYDIKDFKGVIHFPYAWSNLALFENMQLGLVHFVPSRNFLQQLYYSKDQSLYAFFSIVNLEYCEWYNDDHKNVLVYFDSWQDLVQKIKTTDFNRMSNYIKDFAQKNHDEMMQRWKKVFNDLGL